MKALLCLILTLLSCTAQASTFNPDPARTLILEGEVGRNAVQLADQMLDMANASNDDIYMIINSPGGSVLSGMQLLTAMQIAEARGIHIRCMVTQLAASMAFITYAQCTDRYAFANSLLLWHPMRSGTEKGVTEEEARAMAEDMARLSKPLILLQWKALDISWKTFYKHYKLETLWVASALKELTPNFMTIVSDVEGVPNILHPGRGSN